MNKNGWLVNDCLTCIPDTRTFWHNLLEWFPYIQDKTNIFTPFDKLANYVESEAVKYGVPGFIIRNATFFRKLDLRTKTISFLQDYYLKQQMHDVQIDVCNHSDIVVFNSPFTENMYKKEIKTKTQTIPIGTDFDLFRPLNNRDELKNKWGISKNCILFIGSTNVVKGFSIVEDLIKNTSYNFCLVMKDDYKTDRKNVKVFNKINHQQLVEIINCCSMLICTSTMETLHLAGIEAAACGLPILATNVGIYYNKPNGTWGNTIRDKDIVGGFVKGVKYILENLDLFDPRNNFIRSDLTKEACREKWSKLLAQI